MYCPTQLAQRLEASDWKLGPFSSYCQRVEIIDGLDSMTEGNTDEHDHAEANTAFMTDVQTVRARNDNACKKMTIVPCSQWSPLARAKGKELTTEQVESNYGNDAQTKGHL